MVELLLKKMMHHGWKPRKWKCFRKDIHTWLSFWLSLSHSLCKQLTMPQKWRNRLCESGEIFASKNVQSCAVFRWHLKVKFTEKQHWKDEFRLHKVKNIFCHNPKIWIERCDWRSAGAEKSCFRERCAGLIYWKSLSVSYFFPCRAGISCSSSHPIRTSRYIATSTCDLHITSARAMSSSATPHIKSRCSQYPQSKINRFPVPDDKVNWSQVWPQYDPVSYTDPAVTKKPTWADPDIG